MSEGLISAFLASSLSFHQPGSGGGEPPAEGTSIAPPALGSLPVLVWSEQLPGLPPAVSTPTEPGAPAVRGDRIFVGYSGTNALLILDRRDGRVVGQLAARSPVSTKPILLDQRVIFSDSAGYTSAWSEGPKGWVRDWEHYSGAPIVAAPTLQVANAATGEGTLYVSNVDELVYALDARSGELRWRYQHRLDAARSGELELFGAPAPAVSDDTVYAGFSDGFVVALDRATGSERWTSAVGEGTYPDLIAAPLPLPDGALLVGGYSKPLLHLDPKTRTPSWRSEVGSAAAPLREGDTLFAPGADGKLRQFDSRTGGVRWTWDSGASGPLLTPVATPLGLLVASTDSTLFLVDRASGVTLWTFDPGLTLTGFASLPAVDGDELFALSNGGRLYALRGAGVSKGPAGFPYVAPW